MSKMFLLLLIWKTFFEMLSVKFIPSLCYPINVISGIGISPNGSQKRNCILEMINWAPKENFYFFLQTPQILKNPRLFTGSNIDIQSHQKQLFSDIFSIFFPFGFRILVKSNISLRGSLFLWWFNLHV